MKHFLMELWSLASRFLNVLSGDMADITLSARAHRDGLRIEPLIDWFFRVAIGEEDHCRIWWEHEVERSLQTVDRATGSVQ